MEQFKRFIELLKILHYNIPFIKDLSQMPSYSKFIKEVISNKFKLDDNETVMATEEFSIIIQNRLVTKLKDSMSFSIPRAIRNTTIDKVLCDLGASVNLMPFSTDKRLDIYEIKTTKMSLQLDVKNILECQ